MWFAIGLLLVAIWLFYKYYVSVYNTYWQNRGIPSYPSTFPYGGDSNFLLFNKFQGYVLDKMYRQLDSHPMFGTFSARNPMLVLRDPELISLILTKEFSCFRERMYMKFDEADVLSQHLFNLEGEKWRALRVKLTPTFSTGKLKAMFPLFINCAETFNSLLLSKINSEVDIKALSSRLTTDIICSCAFGLETNTINEPNHKLIKIGTEVFKMSYWFLIKLLFFLAMPKKLVSYLHMRFTPMETEKYLVNLVESTIAHREKNGIKRNDFLDLLIQLKNKGTLGDDMKDEIEEHKVQPFELSIGLMAAQCFVFFVAGYETSSSVLSFCLYELAIHQDIQTRLRNEIINTIEKHGGVTYQAIQEMEYLDMVVSESLRKYPTLPSLFRSSSKSFTTPMGYTIEKDDIVFIPVWSLHHDADYFPNPEKFDPERFSRENRSSIKPYTYLPFGEGPRMCIGMRFGQLQSKVGLVTVIRNFKIEPCETTKIPLEFSANTSVTSPKEPIMLKLMAYST